MSCFVVGVAGSGRTDNFASSSSLKTPVPAPGEPGVALAEAEEAAAGGTPDEDPDDTLPVDEATSSYVLSTTWPASSRLHTSFLIEGVVV